jgi:hypothetical protein
MGWPRNFSICPGNRRYHSIQVLEINASWFVQFAILPGVTEKIPGRTLRLQKSFLQVSCCACYLSFTHVYSCWTLSRMNELYFPEQHERAAFARAA